MSLGFWVDEVHPLDEKKLGHGEFGAELVRLLFGWYFLLQEVETLSSPPFEAFWRHE
jgi:hypothetical protein